jgi:hypothetical protein
VTRSEIGAMQSLHFIEMRLQQVAKRLRQHHPPILLAFASPHDNFSAIEIDILHTELETFLQA